ncbi:MAG: hypothetical protein L3J71_06900 [Victivallaceae bacterium]|nr:hypothetical protein [Victivallaceae bacterium]
MLSKVMNYKNLPCEVVFHPSWWNKHHGIKFNESYFFDHSTRVKVEQQHRQILFEKFGSLGLGEKNSPQKPVIGPVHLAAGFMISGILGCQFNFYDDGPPEVVPRNMSEEEVMALQVPDISKTYPMRNLLSLMDSLEKEYGYIEGDFNWQGLLNVALDLRGQMFLMDYYTNPELVKHLLNIILKTTLQALSLVRKRTKTSSISVNRIIKTINPDINMHSNCSVTMISKETYDEFHLPYEKKLAEELRPYGIHHCGNDMHKVAESYAQVDPELLDVGWGAEISLCRQKLPDAILSLRIDPVQMNTWTVADVEQNVRRCINMGGARDKLAVCCINMDSNVPEENVFGLFNACRAVSDLIYKSAK